MVATGYCDYDAVLRSEVWETKKLRGHNRLNFILNKLDDRLNDVEPDAVFIEGFSFGSKGRAVYEIGGLGYLVRHRLWLRTIPYCEVSPASLKRYATGHGNANKDEMIAEAVRRFDFPGKDNNAADAWLLLHMGMQLLGYPLIDVPILNKKDMKVTWEGELPWRNQ